MKKLIYLYIVLSLLLMFYGCENAPNILDNNLREGEENNILAKVRPERNVTSDIDYLTIGTWTLIENNEVQAVDDLLLDFRINDTNPSYNIDYKVSHPEGINWVIVKIWCDIIPNGYQWPQDGLLENSGTLFHGYEDQDGFTWDGMIEPDSWDSDVYNDDYMIFDQLATTTHTPDYTDKADYYGISIMVESKGKFPTFTFMQSNTFEVLADGLDNTFHVQSVEINKDKNKTKALIKVVDKEGTDLDGAWVFGYWEGTTDYFKGVTGEDGVAEISGPKKPPNKFSVRSVEKAGSVYNPWSNTNPPWNWPDVEPFGVLDK